MRQVKTPPPLPPRYWYLKPIQLVVIDLMDWLLPFMAINLLWVGLSLTIIGLPPATAALFETVYGAYRSQAPNPRQFLAGVRRWFLLSWLWALANGAIFGGLFLLARATAANFVLVTILSVVGAVIVLGQLYFWAYMMLQEQPELLRAAKNSLFTVLGGLMYTAFYLALMLILLVPAVIVIAPVLLIAPVLFAMLITYSLIHWLDHHGILTDLQRDL